MSHRSTVAQGKLIEVSFSEARTKRTRLHDSGNTSDPPGIALCGAQVVKELRALENWFDDESFASKRRRFDLDQVTSKQIERGWVRLTFPNGDQIPIQYWRDERERAEILESVGTEIDK